MKSFLFKTCPKSGKVRGFRSDSLYHKLLFPLVGFAALCWVLLRVVPKPTRAAYPCQQAAIPAAMMFTSWLLSLVGAAALWQMGQRLVSGRKWLLGSTLTVAGVGLLAVLLASSDPYNRVIAASDVTVRSPFAKPANQPIGQARGIHPGRVTWSRDAKLARWDGRGLWWAPDAIDEQILAQMYSDNLQGLTGETTDQAAWRALFTHFNQQHNRGDRGWQPGEVIAVKINCNNTYEVGDRDNDIDQSPQATRALLQQLVHQAGVAEKDILIYDSSQGWRPRAIPDRIFQPLHKEFPGVRWLDCRGGGGREQTHWQSAAITYSCPIPEIGDQLPQQVVDASYLINVALFKGHEMSGVTLGTKNHFGSIRYPQRDHGKYVTPMKYIRGDYTAYVDLMGSPNLGGKTMLYIVDGVYGMQTNVGPPRPNRDRFKRMFNGEWSACYFMSQDPVAIESVCLDFLWEEFRGELGFSGAPAFPKGASEHCDNYLIEAANGFNSMLGPYRPNGKEIGSLGTHEHWNNSTDKQYSRNLGNDRGIELVQVGG